MMLDPAHALEVVAAVHEDLVRLRKAASAAETEQDAAVVKFGYAELAHKLASLHLDRLGPDLDDPAWHDVETALAALCDDLGISDADGSALPSAKPAPADASKASDADTERAVRIANAMGYRQRGPDLADIIVNGFEGMLRLTARAAWEGTKLAVRAAIAAGKLALPAVVAAGQALGEAGDRIARRWLEEDHPRDANGKWTNKGVADYLLKSDDRAEPVLRLISTQSFRDDDTIAEKQESGDYVVLVTPEFSFQGAPARAVLDGHHSLAAACKDGVEPVLIEAGTTDASHWVKPIRDARSNEVLFGREREQKSANPEIDDVAYLADELDAIASDAEIAVHAGPAPEQAARAYNDASDRLAGLGIYVSRLGDLVNALSREGGGADAEWASEAQRKDSTRALAAIARLAGALAALDDLSPAEAA